MSASISGKRIWLRVCLLTCVLFALTALLLFMPQYALPAAAQTPPVTLPTGTVPSAPNVQLVLAADGFEQPLYLTHANDNSGRIFVVERAGVIRVWQDGFVRPAPFLDIRTRVNSTCSECGLLGLAFAPDYTESGEFYISYTAHEDIAEPGDPAEPESGNDSSVSRFHVTSDVNIADPDSEERILALNQPYRNHNGGLIKFGDDGYLYIGFGDGGSGGDPLNNAQSLDTLLGKMLRIAVGDVPTYTVPVDNPFVGTPNARPEIWQYGLRNPWRWSFDRETGDLFVADVGQGSWEEANYVPASSTGGENYGWRVTEGNHCFNPATGCDTTGFTLPIFEYPNPGGAAITGGYVYRGPIETLHDIYFVGDFGSGQLWGLTNNGTSWDADEFLDTPYNISSFGEDQYGVVYVIDYAGGIHRIVDADYVYPYVTPLGAIFLGRTS